MDEVLSLATSARFVPGEQGAAVIETERGPLRLRDLSEAQAAALDRLATGASEADLVGVLPDVEQQMWLRMTLNRLLALGLVDRSVAGAARIEVIGDGYRPNGRLLPTDQRVRLSRFAYLRQAGGQALLESPRALVRMTFTDWRGPALVGLLSGGTTVESIDWPPGIDPALGAALVQILFQEGFLEPADGGVPPVLEAQALAEWSFHDLLFHERSRQGRHRYPYGASYRFEGVRDPLPAVKPVGDGPVIVLPTPDVAALRAADVPFTEVLESRRSWRKPGPEPLTVEQLGEFLYRTARVRGRRGTEHEEISSRPYPGGGADYELEIYCLVNRVPGIERGLYHYDPLGHGLERIADWTDTVQAVAVDTCRKAPPGEIPDVQLAFTARMMRLTYKYESIPYSVALKDLGVLIQTCYLTATAMGLAPCAVGGGNSELFAAASGVSPFVEPQIGEFLLNTRHPDEA